MVAATIDRNKLIEENLHLAEKAVRKLKVADNEDAVAEAQLGLVEAAERWDGTGSFQAYGYSYAEGKVRTYLGKKRDIAHIPNHTKQQLKEGNLEKVSEKRLAELIGAQALLRPVSIERPKKDAEAGLEIEDRESDNAIQYCISDLKEELRKLRYKPYRKLFSMRFGLGEELPIPVENLAKLFEVKPRVIKNRIKGIFDLIIAKWTICPVCGERFRRTPLNKYYCSEKCHNYNLKCKKLKQLSIKREKDLQKSAGKSCRRCNNPLPLLKRIYCGDKCKRLSSLEKLRERRKNPPRECKICFTNFVPCRTDKVFCQKRCKLLHHWMLRRQTLPLTRQCHCCKQDFIISTVKELNRKFCLSCNPIGQKCCGLGVCHVCEKEFIKRNQNQTCCSIKCSNTQKSNKRKKKRIACRICQKVFETIAARASFCSVKCKNTHFNRNRKGVLS